jgi:glucosamine--fructose-6-phosphate aminotransferase (isomerizing)
MLKEIAEQPRAIADTLLGRLDAGRLTLDVGLEDDAWPRVEKVVVVACGTAYHAGLVARYAIEHWAQVPCEVELASEFRYRDPLLDSRRSATRASRAPLCWRSATPWAR